MFFIKEIVEKKIFIKYEKRNLSVDNYVDYIKFLADLGKMDDIFKSIHFYDKKYIESNFELLKDNSIFSRIKFLVNSIINDNKYNLKDIILHKSNAENSLIYTELLPDKNSHEENLVINFLLLRVIDENSLSYDYGLILIDYFWKAKNCNNFRKDYCIFMIVEKISSNMNFFKLKDKFYNHIQKIYSRINQSTLIDSVEKSLLIEVMSNQIKKNNSIRSTKKNKVAVCISGIYRNHKISLENIMKNIVEPLSADIYIHTWDQKSIWSGIGGSPLAHRIFESDISSLIPKEVYSNLNNLDKFMPNTYYSFKNPIYISLGENEINSVLNSKNMIIEKQDDFEKKFNDHTNFIKLRGSLNQLKMFYGIKESFRLAKDGGDYDYIIRVRPDMSFSEPIDMNLIYSLENNTIYSQFGEVGLHDSIFIISSSMAYNFCQLVDNMIYFNNLSNYPDFPLYDSHNLLLLWMIENNYKFKSDLIKGSLLKNEVSNNNIPNLRSSILKDIENMSNDNKIKFEKFYNKLLENLDKN